jgi:hypothetical protein
MTDSTLFLFLSFFTALHILSYKFPTSGQLLASPTALFPHPLSTHKNFSIVCLYLFAQLCKYFFMSPFGIPWRCCRRVFAFRHTPSQVRCRVPPPQPPQLTRHPGTALLSPHEAPIHLATCSFPNLSCPMVLLPRLRGSSIPPLSHS